MLPVPNGGLSSGLVLSAGRGGSDWARQGVGIAPAMTAAITPNMDLMRRMVNPMRLQSRNCGKHRHRVDCSLTKMTLLPIFPEIADLTTR
jgi:hypothetical protein